MKHKLTILLLVSFLTNFCTEKINADENPGSTPVNLYGDGSDDDEKRKDPSKGKRTSPTPEIIFIDFINNSISGSSILDEVIEYEIWDESGFSILFATSDKRWFVDILASMPKNQGYVLVFKTPYSNYSGSIYF